MTTSGSEMSAVGVEIQRLVASLEGLEDSAVKAQVQALVRLLLSFYGASLSRMIDIVRTEHGGPEAILGRLSSDPLVASLLVLHDLHPEPVQLRVTRALSAVQRHLPPTTLHLINLQEDSAFIRVERKTSGGMSLRDMRAAIERAVHEAAPELTSIEVDGLDDLRADLIQITRRPTGVADADQS